MATNMQEQPVRGVVAGRPYHKEKETTAHSFCDDKLILLDHLRFRAQAGLRLTFGAQAYI